MPRHRIALSARNAAQYLKENGATYGYSVNRLHEKVNLGILKHGKHWGIDPFTQTRVFYVDRILADRAR